MTGTFYSFFWKEYRQLRSFWVAMLALTAFLQLIAWVSTGGTEINVLYAIGLGLPAFYALGCGATMFAAEHDSDTFEFLQALPTHGATTFLSKLAFALVSAPAVIITGWLIAAFLSGFTMPDGGTHRTFWLVAGWFWFELLVWSTLFSLLLCHPMKAAIFGAMGAAFSLHFISGAYRTAIFDLDLYAAVMPQRIAAALAIAAVDFSLAARWYREAKTSRGGDEPRKASGTQGQAAGHELDLLTSKSSEYARLLWLQWRQSRGMITVLSATVLPLVAMQIWHGIDRAFFMPESVARQSSRSLNSGSEWIGLFVLAALLAVPIAGASVFAGDQRRRRYRFLTDRGISPNLFWWSRQPVWIAAAALGFLVVFASIGWALFSRGEIPPQNALESLGFATCLFAAYTVGAYCFGQLCSMIFRSGVVACTLACAGSFLLCGWSGAMLQLEVNPLWSILPIPFILLATTWVRTRGWMLDKNTLTSWLPVLLVLVAPAVAMICGVFAHRAYEIPLVDPGFDVAAFTAPGSDEARETAHLYRLAYDRVTKIEQQDTEQGEDETPQARRERYDRWLAANEDVIAMTMKTSHRAECDGRDVNDTQRSLAFVGEWLAQPLLEKGDRFREDGDLDTAAEYYLAVFRIGNHVRTRSSHPSGMAWAERRSFDKLAEWSVESGQTSKRVLEVVRFLEESVGEPIPMENALSGQYLWVRKLIEGDMAEMLTYLDRDPREAAPVLMVFWLPWEKERALRALSLHTSEQLASYQETADKLAKGETINSPVRYEIERRPWMRSTPIMNLAYDSARWQIEALLRSETTRRAGRIRLALAAWQIDHEGELPEKLDQLADGYLTEVPLDPYAGEPFVYFRDGLKIPITRQNYNEPKVLAEADQPFLWSPGLDVQVHGGSEYPTGKYYIGRSGRERQAVSAQEIWSNGRVLLIPQPRGSDKSEEDSAQESTEESEIQ